MYDQGTGVARNLSEAVRWYRLAARNGDPDALAVLRAQNIPSAESDAASKEKRKKKR
jgi:TPR repeat protein